MMMASSQDQHQHHHQRTSSAENIPNNNVNVNVNDHNDNNHPHAHDSNDRPPLPQPQTVGYPPVMGYPPPGQYPPHGHCPPPPPYNAYTAPPGYYNHNQPPCLNQQHPPTMLPASRFVSGILAVVVFFIILSCTISIIAYVILHPVNPEFQITGLAVSNFGVSPGVPITGSFEANVTVDNPNEKLRVRFHNIESYMYFKNPAAELAWTTAAPFLMETNTTHVMTMRSLADGDVGGDDLGDDGEVRGDEEAAAAMEKEWRNGTVEMGLMMGMWATFRSGNGWWSSRVAMRVQCDELWVVFPGVNGTTSGTGSWPGNGLPKKCNAYR